MESLNTEAIDDDENFLLEVPWKDNDEAILQQFEQVATIQETDLAEFEDANAAVVEATKW